MVPAASPGIEGALHIRLALAGGRVDGVDVCSSRPLGAARLFVGKPIDQVLTTLPLLYGICATAQSAAAVQAAEQTLGRTADWRQQRAREMLVLVETAREHLVRVLMGWTQWLGEPPLAAALRLVGRLKPTWNATLYPDADGFLPGGGALTRDVRRLQVLIDELSGLIEQHVLGMERSAWLGQQDSAMLVSWADSGGTSAARLLGTLVQHGRGALGRSDISVLGGVDSGELAQRLDRQDADDFISAPTWNDQPCETGALARECDTPLVRSLFERYGNGLLTRQAARLCELAHLPEMLRRLLSAMDAPEPPESSDVVLSRRRAIDSSNHRGIGLVEAARGILVHSIELDGDQVCGYRILAPTEWNFHPDGALVRGLCGLEAGDDLSGMVRLLVDAIDPCVGYQLEVVDSAGTALQ